jgi:hypothetical protein
MFFQMIMLFAKKFPKLTFFIEFYGQNRAPLQLINLKRIF